MDYSQSALLDLLNNHTAQNRRMIQAFSRAIQADPKKVPHNLPQMIENVNNHVTTLTDKVAMLTKNTDTFTTKMNAIYDQLDRHRQTLDTLNDRLVADEKMITSTSAIEGYKDNAIQKPAADTLQPSTSGTGIPAIQRSADTTVREATPAQNNPQNNETGEFSTVENFFGGAVNLLRDTNYYLKENNPILLDKKYKVGNTSTWWYYSLSKDNVIRYYINDSYVYNTDNKFNTEMTDVTIFVATVQQQKSMV